MHAQTDFAPLPPQLARGAALLAAGNLQQAEELVREYLLHHGAHIEGMRLLAQIAVRLGVLDDAEYLLGHLLERAPAHQEARGEYAAVLLQRRRYLPALHEARRLLQQAPGNARWRRLYASACDGLGAYDEALRIYRELLEETPDAELQLSIAHLLKTRGSDPGEAVAAFRAATRLPQGAGEAFLALANTKSYRFSEEEIARMRAAEAIRGSALGERYRLCFALGKALEDRHEYAASFEYYQRGNSLKRSELAYRPEMAQRHLRSRAEVRGQHHAPANVGEEPGKPWRIDEVAGAEYVNRLPV